jgi:hypothetical protein
MTSTPDLWMELQQDLQKAAGNCLQFWQKAQRGFL